MKDESEIQKVVDDAADRANAGSKYPGMSYEEGIRAALEWVLDDDMPSADLF